MLKSIIYTGNSNYCFQACACKLFKLTLLVNDADVGTYVPG
jgi:hypothetical protein